jgi:hypothetical protein
MSDRKALAHEIAKRKLARFGERPRRGEAPKDGTLVCSTRHRFRVTGSTARLIKLLRRFTTRNRNLEAVESQGIAPR